jgi:CII-binding regulator of phage lambda lysogenization HflD
MDRLFRILLEIFIFCGLVIGTLFISKYGFEYLFKYLDITSFTEIAYNYAATVYSFLIGLLIWKLDLKYRKIESLRDRIKKLEEKIKHVKDDEHHLKDEIIKIIS